MYQQDSLFPEDADRSDSEHETPIDTTLRIISADANRKNSGQMIPIGATSRTLITGDWERGVGWLFFDGQQVSEMSREDFLGGKLFEQYPGCLLVIEGAHLQERQGKSLAQVYTRQELDVLADGAAASGIAVKVFPQKLTPRARQETGLSKNDKDGDVRAVHFFAVAHPEIGLKSWRFPNERDHILWQARGDIRDDMNVRLNQMRVRGYEGTVEYERAHVLLRRLWLECKLTEEAIKWFEIQVYGRRHEKLRFNKVAVMSIYVAVFNEDGDLRRNKGQFIGVRGVRGIIQLSPYHFKSGTARSNLMWHRLRNALHEKDEGRKPEERREFSHAVTDLIQAFRDSSEKV